MKDIRLLEAAAEADDIFVTYGRVPPADVPEAEDEQPLKPTMDTKPREFYEREVEYDHVRQPGDIVLSGPIIGGWGPGRYFQNRWQALNFYTDKYGSRVKRMQRQTKGRWSVLLKKEADNAS